MIPVLIQFYAVAHEHPCLGHHEKSSQPATDFQTSSRNFGEGFNMQELTPEASPSVACGAYWCTLHGSLERLQDSAHQVGIFESWRLGDRACGRAIAACPSDSKRNAVDTVTVTLLLEHAHVMFSTACRAAILQDCNFILLVF